MKIHIRRKGFLWEWDTQAQILGIPPLLDTRSHLPGVPRINCGFCWKGTLFPPLCSTVPSTSVLLVAGRWRGCALNFHGVFARTRFPVRGCRVERCELRGDRVVYLESSSYKAPRRTYAQLTLYHPSHKRSAPPFLSTTTLRQVIPYLPDHHARDVPVPT